MARVDLETPTSRSRGAVLALKAAIGLVAVFLFILALQLLKEGAGALGPLVQHTLGVDDAAGALGFGWVSAYVVLSGSPVAAMALTLFASGVLNEVQTFLAITGSRLGAAFVVLVIGVVYRLRGRGHGTSLQMGVLSLLVTYSVYAPAAVAGYVLLSSGALDTVNLAPPTRVVDVIDITFDPLVAIAAARLPPAGLFVAGFVVLLGAFKLFDHALPEINAGEETPRLDRVVFRPLVMFAVGFGVTLATLSVSVSLGLLVPLSAKGIVRRENIIPYILGANVSTFIDTLFASLIVGVPRAVTIVLAEIIAVAALSVLLLLVGYRTYERSILRALDAILASRARFITFLVIILVAPVVLILV